MKADVFDLEGKPTGTVNLPKVFQEPVREDLVKRAVLSTQSKKRQPYSPNLMAGKRTSAHYHGRRRIRYTMAAREKARLPRIHGRTVPFLTMQARFVPSAVKGRRAHPPKVERVWAQKINKKERNLAVRSALAATAVKELVLKRGHKVEDVKSVPIVVEDKLQELKKTKEVVDFLKKIGLGKELERISEKNTRPGKGKMRGRRYKIKTGPLFVVTDGKITKTVNNLLGCDVCRVDSLSVDILAPGAGLGRLAIFTKSAVEKLSNGVGK